MLDKDMLVTIVNIEANQSYFTVATHNRVLAVNSRMNGIPGLYTVPWVQNGRYIQFIMKPSAESEARILRELDDLYASAYFHTAILGDLNNYEETNSARLNGPIFWDARDKIDKEKGCSK